MKILIFGASGCGTTTLGKEFAKRTDFAHLDLDDYYWERTVPPYQIKIPFIVRNKNLETEFKKNGNIVISGSMVHWGQKWTTAFDLAIFMRLANGARMKRLKMREVHRYGEKLTTDKKLRTRSLAFLEWVNQYEDQAFDGRSLKGHNEWIELLDCKVLRLNGAVELKKNVGIILDEMKAIGR